jgi:hypothetical protein
MPSARLVFVLLALVAALFGGVVTMWCCTPAVAGPTIAAACPMEKACCGGGSRTTTGPSCVIGPAQQPSAGIVAGIPAHLGVTVMASPVERPCRTISFGASPGAALGLLSAATIELRI